MTPDSQSSSFSTLSITTSSSEVYAAGFSPPKSMRKIKAQVPAANFPEPSSTKSEIYKRQLTGMTKGDLELMRDLAEELLEEQYPTEFLPDTQPQASIDKRGRPQKSTA
jgi:hypothetical protein